MFSLLFLSVARPVTPAVWFGLYKHYDLVSLFSPRGTSLDYCFRRHYLFSPRQLICYQIHDLHCSKAFQHHVQILCILESRSMPPCIFVNLKFLLASLQHWSRTQVRLNNIVLTWKNVYYSLQHLTHKFGGSHGFVIHYFWDG